MSDNKSKFDYWQLQELDARYQPKEKSGCLSILGWLLLMGLFNWLALDVIISIQRLEWNAGIERTFRQKLGLDPDPITQKRIQMRNVTPTPPQAKPGRTRITPTPKP